MVQRERAAGKLGGLGATLRVLASTTFLRPYRCAGLLYLLAQLTGVSTMVTAPLAAPVLTPHCRSST